MFINLFLVLLQGIHAKGAACLTDAEKKKTLCFDRTTCKRLRRSDCLESAETLYTVCFSVNKFCALLQVDHLQ